MAWQRSTGGSVGGPVGGSLGGSDGGSVVADARTGDDIGGYRLVRRLGSGTAAEVHLALPIAGGDPVAIKLARPHVQDAQVLAEVHALWRARGAHAVELLDVIDRGDRAPALVLQRLPTALTALLRSPEGIGPSAAATVLLPIAATLRRIHAAGVAHGRLGPAAIRLDDRGAPAIVGFGGAVRFAPNASAAVMSATSPVIEDVRAFRRLALSMLEPGAEAPAARVGTGFDAAGLDLAQLGDEVDIARDAHAWLLRFESHLFDRITPGPVAVPSEQESRLGPETVNGLGVGIGRRTGTEADSGARAESRRESDPGLGARRRMRRASSVPAATVRSAPGDDDARWRRARPPARRGLSAAVGMLDDLGARAQAWAADRLPDGVAASAVPTLRRMIATAGPVRARAWVPAALVGLALVAVVVVLPIIAAESPVDASVDASDRDVGASATPSSVPTLGADRGSGDGPDSARDRDSAGDPDVVDPDVVDPDSAGDPELAAVELLDQRAACLGARDPACIGVVVQSGSPAASADLTAMASESDAAPSGASWRAESAVLVDLLGGAALIDVVVATPEGTGTVPVLLVLSESRWRIRAILAEPAMQRGGPAN